jgi:hypothetical protein
MERQLYLRSFLLSSVWITLACWCRPSAYQDGCFLQAVKKIKAKGSSLSRSPSLHPLRMVINIKRPFFCWFCFLNFHHTPFPLFASPGSFHDFLLPLHNEVHINHRHDRLRCCGFGPLLDFSSI